MRIAQSRIGFAALVILAVLLRALIPAGFMPENAAGKMAITICHGADLQTIYVDAPAKPGKPTKTECAFAPIAQSDQGMDVDIAFAVERVAYPGVLYRMAQNTDNADHAYEPGQPRAPPILL